MYTSVVHCDELEDVDLQETVKFLESLEEVELVHVPTVHLNTTNPIGTGFSGEPSLGQLSPTAITILLAAYTVNQFAAGAIREGGKDVYVLMKKRIVERLNKRQEERSVPLSKRLQFWMDEQGDIRIKKE